MKDPNNGAMETLEFLFGSRISDYERRILSMENRLTKEMQSLREDIMKRIDGLETSCKEKLDAQRQRSAPEEGRRTEAVNELSRFNPFLR